MAKKKKAPKSYERPDVVEYDEDTEALSLFLTNLVAAISPTIDKATTYELCIEMLMQGIDDDTAEFYGALIRGTSFLKTSAVGGIH